MPLTNEQMRRRLELIDAIWTVGSWNDQSLNRARAAMNHIISVGPDSITLRSDETRNGKDRDISYDRETIRDLMGTS
jgi:hypothetical protein